jgi:hypothetical protein
MIEIEEAGRPEDEAAYKRAHCCIVEVADKLPPEVQTVYCWCAPGTYCPNQKKVMVGMFTLCRIPVARRW